jgi:hypothetical protein
MTIDVKQTINYSAAVRKQKPHWTDDQVRRAAEYLLIFMDVRLEPYALSNKLEEFEQNQVFGI